MPHAMVIVGVLCLMAFLAWQKVDSAPTVVGVVTVLGALGFVIHKQGEQSERTASIQTTVNGNTTALLQTIQEQIKRAAEASERRAEEFRSFAQEQQRAMSDVVANNALHMRELADKLAEMVPPNAVPQVITLPPIDTISGVGNGGPGNGSGSSGN